MKLRILSPAVLLFAAFFGGCDSERQEIGLGSADQGRGVELFEKNKGVRLPPEMQRDLGVATVEVAEKSVTSRVEKRAQVYRAATGASPAAAVVWLNDAEAKDLRAGQGVRLGSIDSAVAFAAGRLVRLEKSSSIAPGHVEALIEFNDAEERFPVGSSLAVVFSAERAHTSLMVPESAVIHGAGGAFVYAVNGEHFTRTPVKLGAAADGWVEITDGLYADDIVAAKAADSLWLIELCALKGGTPCCPVPAKKRND